MEEKVLLIKKNGEAAKWLEQLVKDKDNRLKLLYQKNLFNRLISL